MVSTSSSCARATVSRKAWWSAAARAASGCTGLPWQDSAEICMSLSRSSLLRRAIRSGWPSSSAGSQWALLVTPPVPSSTARTPRPRR